MVLTNLFAEQQWSCRHREETWGEEGEGKMNAESIVDTYTLTHVNRRPMGIC